jgi:hypothetical protein
MSFSSSKLSEEQKSKYQLIVDVRSAKNLEDKKLIGDHAVYVAVDVEKQTKRTTTIKDILNPRWNETLIFELNEIPEEIQIRVRDDRMILPNLNLGYCTLNIKERLLSYDPLVPTTLQNGEAQLLDSSSGSLDFGVIFQDGSRPYLSPSTLVSSNNTQQNNNLVQGPYQEVKENNFLEIPEQVFDKVQVHDDVKLSNEDENMRINNEYHVLPTIKVQEAPTIIEKEVEYIKPVEIHQTIIEKEIPTIIERPIIVQKQEHYLEPTQVIHEENKIITERKDNEYFNVNEQETIENLRKERQEAFNNQVPLVEHRKEEIILDTDFQERPDEIRTKNIVYEQPIEIERKEIETIQPTIVENVAIEKEHITQKEQPQIVTQEATLLNNKDRYYSQEQELLPQ